MNEIREFLESVVENVGGVNLPNQPPSANESVREAAKLLLANLEYLEGCKRSIGGFEEDDPGALLRDELQRMMDDEEDEKI